MWFSPNRGIFVQFDELHKFNKIIYGKIRINLQSDTSTENTVMVRVADSYPSDQGSISGLSLSIFETFIFLNYSNNQKL